ncbi:hypothetical protein SK128_015827, partial [Halocaridina rubra]
SRSTDEPDMHDGFSVGPPVMKHPGLHGQPPPPEGWGSHHDLAYPLSREALQHVMAVEHVEKG